MSSPTNASNTTEPAPAGYRFTPSQDWLTPNMPTWRTYFAQILATNPAPRALEIGSWEGRSAVFLLTELCGAPGPRLEGGGDEDGDSYNGAKRPEGAQGSITCIDHFDLFRTSAGRERHTKLVHNLALTGGRWELIPKFSVPGIYDVLRTEIAASERAQAQGDPATTLGESVAGSQGRQVEPPGFDFIYIDGSHHSADTFLDAELAWRVARPNAIVVFDDYLWPQEPQESMYHPKRGIDAFLQLHRGEYEMLSGEGAYQVAVRKTVEMRIGFLVGGEDKLEQGVVKESGGGVLRHLGDSFEYGIHLVLALDSSYAMAGGVALHSALSHTTRRTTVHIINCGLTGSDQAKLAASVPAQCKDRATIVYHALPEDGLARKHGAVWAKVDMLMGRFLPVERCLYLDADVLVRGDIGELWDEDLCGLALGAAYDVGFPCGPPNAALTRKNEDESTHSKASYFNAGVLLLDLALIRQHHTGILAAASRFLDCPYKDQDALNAHFHNAWKPLHMSWNATGLGTYGDIPSPGRQLLPRTELEEMRRDPRIVHFTGPVNPSLMEVLNPYVQPYTAKPWGYAGAPGHPCEEEWWKAVEKTGWRGWRGSEEAIEGRKRGREDALKSAAAVFAKKFGE